MVGFSDLSLVAMFDELCRCHAVLRDGAAETKFVEFVDEVDKQRVQWNTAVDDCQRKHGQLVESNANVTRLQNQIKQAQNLLDNEQRRRRAAEQELAVIEERFTMLRELVVNEPAGVVNNDTRQKVLQWSQPVSADITDNQQQHRHSSTNKTTANNHRLGTISESVGSLLSVGDLSVDYTEDDVDVSRLRSGRVVQRARGFKRVSDSCDTDDDDGVSATRAKSRYKTAKRRNRQSSPEDTHTITPATNTASASGGGSTVVTTQSQYIPPRHHSTPTLDQQHAVFISPSSTDPPGVNDIAAGHVVATTTVVVPHDGPVTATSQIRARSSSRSPRARRSQGRHEPASGGGGKRSMDRSFSEPPPVNRTPLIPSTGTKTPAYTGAASAWDVRSTPHAVCGTPVSFTPVSLRHYGSAGKGIGAGGGGVHVFHEKTIIKPEPCGTCGKRIYFGKQSLRCRDCRAVCHPGCRDRVPLPCVPASAVTPVGSRSGNTRNLQLADCVPPRGLMVPALVQHCVHHIEQHAMSEVGLYRVPGSEGSVKELKSKFLRGKGVPRLADYEHHVICGCMKDFLRSLSEPVVSRSQWHEFVRASCDDDEPALYQAVANMAKPNKDTLAFIILHLQRVITVPENRMSKLGLARIFGPSLVGYSTLDGYNHTQLMAETGKIQIVMERLIELPNDYWCRLIETSLQSAITDTPSSCHNSATGTARSADTPLRNTPSLRHQRHLSYR